jgi:hypothetical protein
VFRSFAVKSVMSVAAGIGIFLFSPMTVQAIAVAPSTTTIALAAIAGHATPASDTDPFIDLYTGLTYPDTSAGLSACDAEGAYLQANGQGEIPGYYCTLGNPNAGVYNLWVVEWNPNYCRTC